MIIKYPNISPPDGQFIDGGPNNLGTIATAEWFNDTQASAKSISQEIYEVLKRGGVAPFDTMDILESNQQLADLLDKRFAGLKTDLTDLYAKLRLACPVGLLGSSVDVKPFNNHWLSLTGELIARSDYPLLYDYFLGLDYKPDSQQLIKLPDARGLVFRSQNKGRFTDVTEIGIGAYQADATQKVTGKSGASVRFVGYPSTGVFYDEVTVAAGAAGGGNGVYFSNFDNSRAARTALEERVKSLGTNAQIFIGLEDLKL